MEAKNVFKRGINATVAYDALNQLELNMINIGSEDILAANRKLMLSVLWQLLKMSQKISSQGEKTDANLLNWAGLMTNLEQPLKSFNDPRFANSNLLFQIVDACDDDLVDWSLVNPGKTEK